MNENIVKIVDQIAEMSVMDVVNLTKAMEERFGVSAAVSVAAAPAAPAGEAEAVEEKTEFTVMLTSYGTNKIGVIKAIRAITGLPLKEAKDLVEGAPSVVKEDISKEEADKMKSQLEESGGSVELK